MRGGRIDVSKQLPTSGKFRFRDCGSRAPVVTSVVELESCEPHAALVESGLE